MLDWLLLVSLSFDLPQPPVQLGDLHRFPPQVVCQQQIKAGRAFRQFAELRRDWHYAESCQWWYWYDAECEAENLVRVWDWLDSAHCTDWGDSTRLAYLEELRDFLGPEAYAAGRMPPAGPVWRYQR